MNNNYMRNANMRNCGCSQQNRNMQQRNAMPAVETYNKNKGLMSIYELGFAMTEALLYLDTHPDDAEAIEYYNSIKPQYSEAVADYAECFGAIIAPGTNGCGYWNWQATPLPWEKEGC